MAERSDNQNRDRTPDFSEAFCSFVHLADEKQLREAIEAAGADPDSLAQQGRAVVEKVISQYVMASEEESRKKQERAVLRQALSTLLQLLRRREGLSQEDLATKARVEIAEVLRIESDFSYSPNPRTIYQLEQTFKLPPRTLVRLSGLSGTRSGEFTERVMRFAANAKTMTSLTKAERALLNEFMQFLILTENQEQQ